jgi:hypothetical protein
LREHANFTQSTTEPEVSDMPDEKRHEDRRRERESGEGEPLHPDATDPRAKDPHSALNNPATDPDPTEFPDPYDQRPDPRDPATVDTPASPRKEDEAERPANPRAPSTSEPHPPRNYDDVKPVKGG